MNIKYLGNPPEDGLPPLKIPFFLDRVPVGWPSPADDYIENPIDLNKYLIKNTASTYFVRVSGDSMINAYIGDGATLIVDRSIEPRHGKIIIAIVDGAFTCKRILFKPTLCLVSENPKYSPIYLNNEEELETAGTVIASINIY